MIFEFLQHPCVDPYRSLSCKEKAEWITGDLMSAHDTSEAAVVWMQYYIVSTTFPKCSNDNPVYDVQDKKGQIRLLNTEHRYDHRTISKRVSCKTGRIKTTAIY